jgi:hypothetical protein
MKKSTSKPAPKKAAKKQASLGRPMAAAKKIARPAGYTVSHGGRVLVPEPVARKAAEGIVPASKLQNGIAKAREQISGVLQELLEATRDGYEVTEIELAASFNADGKFLGFGVGGEMSICFKVRPVGEA